MANEELTKKVLVKELKEELGLVQIAGDENSLKREIIVPDVNRPGLELTGFSIENDLRRVMIIGNKEVLYLDTLDKETRTKRLELLTDKHTPCLIISSRIQYQGEILEVAQKNNFPVFFFNGKTYEAVVEVVQFLSEKMAPSDTLHGVMMNIYGIGVLITGPSGVGKSELGLDLINRGHMLVADDRVDVIRVHNELHATAPNVLKGMLEVRGLGIVDVALLFGAKTILDSSDLNLVISLVKYDGHEFDRLNPIDKKIEILGLERTLVEIPVSEGRPISVIVESAVTNFILKRQGINTTEAFKANILKEIEKNRVK